MFVPHLFPAGLGWDGSRWGLGPVSLCLCCHILHTHVHKQYTTHVCRHTHRPGSFLGSLQQVCRTCLSYVSKSHLLTPQHGARAQGHQNRKVPLLEDASQACLGTSVRLGVGRILSPRGLQRWKAWMGKALQVLLLTCPKCQGQVPGSPTQQEGPSHGGWSSRLALGPPVVSASAFILTPATTLLATVLNPKM